MGLRTGISKTLIILVSLASAIAGSLLIYFSVQVTKSAWLDVFESSGDAYVRDSSFYSLLAAGIIVLIISLAGLIGALREKPCLLSFYTIFLTLAVVIFGILAALCFLYHAAAGNWQEEKYPASEFEPEFAMNFNKVYCYSQGLYYCTKAPAGDTFQSFFPVAPGLSIDKLNEFKGINSLCASPDFSLFRTVDAINQMCTACQQAEKYENYDQVYAWSNEECPLTINTPGQLKWCGDFLFQEKLGSAHENAPYEICRSPVLEFWSTWSLTFGIVATIITAAFFLLIVTTCYVRSKIKQRHREAHYRVQAQQQPAQHGMSTQLV